MYVLRHGQSFFNLHFSATRVDPGIQDPELTALGIEQATAATRRLSDVPLSCIIISPFTRALQTAAPIVAAHSAAVIIDPGVGERAAFSCDIGSGPEVLAARFPRHDFKHLPSRWWHDGLETEQHTVARADAFRQRMAARQDARTTLLVSHWAFIMALTGVSLPNGDFLDYDPRVAAPRHIDWIA